MTVTPVSALPRRWKIGRQWRSGVEGVSNASDDRIVYIIVYIMDNTSALTTGAEQEQQKPLTACGCASGLSEVSEYARNRGASGEEFLVNCFSILESMSKE